MFVPVACSQCGKPFQVPEAVVGQPTACPWCRAAVLALPVGGPAVATPGDSRPPARQEGQEEPLPLPLDDAPPAPPARAWLWVIAVGLLAPLAAVATVGVLRHNRGHLTGWEWRTFTPPDGSFSADLLGRAKEVPGAAGQTWYASEGWYSGTSTWVGWRDLTQAEKQLAGTKDAWQHFGKAFDAELERLNGRYGGAVRKKATVKFEDPLTHELHLEYPGGRAVERIMVFPGGRNPRVYFVGLSGRIEFDGPEARRLFDSFRVVE